ncbi:MAG: MG2 domain-containing protein, partial [Gammaproteobacteria bacterium]|nr:MG2 domain-containing protein [Gammaproteobacteria bacterium]
MFAAGSALGARVESFSPQGFNKDVRQVAVRFSAAMAALGDPGRTGPFVVDCPVAGTGRWIDERHWVYDFEYDVPGGVMCRFNVRDDATTLAGEPVEPQQYAFHTGGPSILDHRPKSSRTWESAVVDERQVFLLALDGAADNASIRRHARCRVARQPDDIPVEVLEGEARAEVLRALQEASPRTLSGLVWSARAHLPGDAADAFERVVLVKCSDELPGGSELRLVWGAGISSGSGAANVDDQILEFVVRPRFRIELDCSASFEGKCLGSVTARFTTPVNRLMAERVRVVDEHGVALVWESGEEVQVPHVRYPATLAENSSYRVELSGPIEDIDGRPLENAADFPATIKTGRMPPGASFGTGLRVVAAREGALAPVLLRRPPERMTGYRLRVDGEREIAQWLRRVRRVRWDWSWEDGWPNLQAATQSILANEQGVRQFTLTAHQSDAPFGSAGVAIGEPGLHVLELPLPASTAPNEGRFVLGTVMATNLAIDFQHGYESSLVWVTGVDDANPVANAEVRLSHGCAAEPLWRGRTDVNGLARIGFPLPWGPSDCRESRLISARKDGDLSVVEVSGPWWYGRGRNQSGPTRFHTIFDRSLYQPGETVSMKHVLRIPTSDGFGLPPGLPTSADLILQHDGSGERYRQTVDLEADGMAESRFELPPEAKLGWYDVELKAGDLLRHRAGFRVERFRTGTMRAAISGPDDAADGRYAQSTLANPKSVPLVLRAWHLAGGPAAYLPVVLRIEISGDHPYHERYWRDRHWKDDSGGRESEVRTEHLTLDADGEARFEVRDLPSFRYAGGLDVDMYYADANGQFRTESNRFYLAPAAIVLAVGRRDRSADRFRILARYLDGSLAAGIAVDAGLFSYARHEVEVRLPGGFRARRWDSTSHLEAECAGRTDLAGALTCEIPPHRHGAYLLVRATASDEQGNVARLAARVPEPAARPFVETDSEEPSSPGSTVSLDVDSPFAAATALVSVHREGVLDAFVAGLEKSNSPTTVVIEPNYAPNVSVSVLARNQPRTPVPAPMPQIVQTGANAQLLPRPDGPSWRRGAVRVAVDWATNTLDVRLTADRETYKPRERVGVKIRVLGSDGAPRPDAELTVAAVDEGLLDLRPNRSWDILDVMMRPR